MQRPTGVSIIAVLAVLGGLAQIILGLGLMALSSVSSLAGLLPILGLVSLVAGALELGFAYGAWTLKPWAWMLGIVLGIVAIVLDVLTLVAFGGSTGILNVVFWGVIIYYLYQPHVRRAFGQIA